MGKLKYGMVGGGPGAFIGEVHRIAARMDGLAELVAGAFSTTHEKSAEQGRQLGLDPERVYGSYTEMVNKESSIGGNQRLDFVSIVTPNSSHFEIASAFIKKGIHIICDKPLTTTVSDADELVRLVHEHNVVFALTHNYTGYPMVKEAREWVRAGRLGEIRKVVVEYPQGWLSSLLEETGMKQAVWRTDPNTAGVSSCISDIGTHAYNLVNYVCGLEIEEICADLGSVPGRVLDDDGNILVRFAGGVRGLLFASQISLGEENALRVRIYGSKAALDWSQESPENLWVKFPDQPARLLRRGHDYLSDIAKHNTRLPAGHPEGFLEAFANIYANACRTIAARKFGETPEAFDLDFPTVVDGAMGVHFIHKAVESSQARAWIDARYPGKKVAEHA